MSSIWVVKQNDYSMQYFESAGEAVQYAKDIMENEDCFALYWEKYKCVVPDTLWKNFWTGQVLITKLTMVKTDASS